MKEGLWHYLYCLACLDHCANARNRKLLRAAAALFGDCTYVDADLKIPVYDGDIEEADGPPETVTLLGAQIAQADAILISAPEYN